MRAIEAHRQHTILHCLERDIVVRRSFAETIRLFGDELLAVHRSYAVNPLHVRSVSHTSVTLDNGVCIPLPQRRARQVREQLERAMHESTPVLDSYELIETMGVRPDAQTAHGSVEDAAHT